MALQTADSVVDLRQQQLEQWLFECTGEKLTGEAAGSDAGFRRYFRYQLDGKTVIAMDAPPATEDCRPFVKVASLLADAGVLVPSILFQDLERGFLLLSDLGLHTYLEVMQQPDFTLQQADDLFKSAISALIKFQCASAENVLPTYDEALLRRELELFPEWYIKAHLGLTVDGELRALLDQLFDQLIEQVLSQKQCYVHRDYMPRNLMINNHDDKGVGVLDFQDAVYGPISYDIASLFKDAFISWPETSVEQWQQRYWQQALEVGLPVPAQWQDFQRDIDVMGAQRHIKVIGIFARICHRDGKPRYLGDVPRFFNYLAVVAQRCPELSTLATLLEHLQAKVPEVASLLASTKS